MFFFRGPFTARHGCRWRLVLQNTACRVNFGRKRWFACCPQPVVSSRKGACACASKHACGWGVVAVWICHPLAKMQAQVATPSSWCRSLLALQKPTQFVFVCFFCATNGVEAFHSVVAGVPGWVSIVHPVGSGPSIFLHFFSVLSLRHQNWVDCRYQVKETVRRCVYFGG